MESQSESLACIDAARTNFLNQTEYFLWESEKSGKFFHVRGFVGDGYDGNSWPLYFFHGRFWLQLGVLNLEIWCAYGPFMQLKKRLVLFACSITEMKWQP